MLSLPVVPSSCRRIVMEVQSVQLGKTQRHGRGLIKGHHTASVHGKIVDKTTAGHGSRLAHGEEPRGREQVIHLSRPVQRRYRIFHLTTKKTFRFIFQHT